MPETEIGVQRFYSLDTSLNISTTLEMPLDKMRIVYPLQENLKKNPVNIVSIEYPSHGSKICNRKTPFQSIYINRQLRIFQAYHRQITQ